MIDRRTVKSQKLDCGPYLAKIVSHIDPTYMGTLQVELMHNSGNTPNADGNVFQVRYLSPFYGVTSVEHTSANDDYSSTQKSYGFWAVPPDVGAVVLVIFVEGDPARGYWIGCVQDEFMNFMVPGIAATTMNSEGKKLPVAEYNKRTYTGESFDPTKFSKPIHPFTKVLEEQGLLVDETRGITTSSARREVPSMVFGISTPGPLDKGPGAPRGRKGTREASVESAFTSRLGGSSFVMDDGDDKFLRKGHASTTPPVYANAEAGDTSGRYDIPHNELVRIRTRTGHQILLHNSEDLIYIGNSRGTAWIELTSNGKIDIFASDSVSIHTKNDFNFVADRDINLLAGRNINVNALNDHKLTVKNNVDVVVGQNLKASITGTTDLTSNGDIKVTTLANFDLKIGANGKLTTAGNMDIKTGGNNAFTAGGSTDVLSVSNFTNTAAKVSNNGPGAKSASNSTAAQPATPAPVPVRVPQHEPWNGHENLNPSGSSPLATLATYELAPNETMYTGIPDTFKKGS